MSEEKKVLHLTLHRKWFDAIASGEKKTQYRRITHYWSNRLFTNAGMVDGSLPFRKFDEVHFRNGYHKDAPFMRVEWKGCSVKTGTPFGTCFAIQLGNILEIRNYK